MVAGFYGPRTSGSNIITHHKEGSSLCYWQVDVGNPAQKESKDVKNTEIRDKNEWSKSNNKHNTAQKNKTLVIYRFSEA